MLGTPLVAFDQVDKEVDKETSTVRFTLQQTLGENRAGMSLPCVISPRDLLVR